MTKTYDDLADRIAKLPGWAQEYFADLVRERDRAVERLRSYLDDQAESPFYEENSGPAGNAILRRYIQASCITCTRGNLEVEVTPQGWDNGITVRFQGARMGRAAIVPEATNSIRIVELPDGA
jgi:hypothetical protein